MTQIQNLHNREHVSRIFNRAAHIQALGIELSNLGAGWCETHLVVEPRHLQQTDVVHAGVQATIADHTAGAAGSTLLDPDEYVLTVEFKVNFLRAARADELRCRADVLKPGRMLSVVESKVYAQHDGTEKLVATATVTLAVMKKKDGSML
ncbi:MAG: PaaI family thioesterase [Rhodothermales bacterium]